MSHSAYVDGLKMLARRELSEAQVRQRLARRGHSPDAIDQAIGRLRGERAIDDDRTAQAIARTESSIHRRGERRVRRRIESAGIGAETARRATETVFAGIDPEGHLEAALVRRLRGRLQIADESEFARLYRYLVGQGFDPDRVLAHLEKRRAR